MDINGQNFGNSLFGNKQPSQTNKVQSLNLSKEQSFILTSLDTRKPIENIALGLKWQTISGIDMDLDVSVVLLEESKDCYNNIIYQVKNPHKEVIYFRQPDTGYGVRHGGDSRRGNAVDVDDETVEVNLSKVPPQIKKIDFLVTIYDCFALKQNFGQVLNASIRVDDMTTGRPMELCKYQLNNEFSTETSVVIASLIKDERGFWKFKAVGKGEHTDLNGLLYGYGVR